MLRALRRWPVVCLLTLHTLTISGCSGASEEVRLTVPATNAAVLRIITPRWLELEYVQPKAPSPASLEYWKFATPAARNPDAFNVTVNGRRNPVTRTSFKQRVAHAPLKQWDLRVAGWLYLELANPLSPGDQVNVLPSNGTAWPTGVTFECRAEETRVNPALHVNQGAYWSEGQKLAFLGYYLGSIGELNLAESELADFQILESDTHKEVFRGKFKRRPDRGFPEQNYQHVWQADFTQLKRPGRYILRVQGLGASHPFWVSEGAPAILARTYALGLYHQRCGTANELPFTRFTHDPCHTRPALVPDSTKNFEAVNDTLRKETENARENARHTAPKLAKVSASLYPFRKAGPVDVRGGHHDAGDYSKYTINSAGLIHLLMFAADNFPGVAALDNLGLPESGDGKSDVLQEAKWEADFLRKMQDSDGGFYFLVYPRDRRYEDNVLPDKGDEQVVFPKTTAATAASVAALAQCASSRAFQAQFPQDARACLEAALRGWTFLTNAISKHGKEGSYQKITHYGDEFMHDDELAWAAVEVYLATKDPGARGRLVQWLRPGDPATRKWGWVRLYDAFGCAIRSYAFAESSGRAKADELVPGLVRECQDEVAFAGQDQLRRAENSAYGLSFPEETKRARSAGWFFVADPAFDLATACQLNYPSENDPRPAMIDAILSNFAYEAGCNPVNVSYLTGLGVKRQFEVVHQYAQNDRRLLPPTGIPLGCVQEGISWLHVYQSEPGALSFPPDGASSLAYPMYDRWSDAFNLSQEFVILQQARGLATWSWLMAKTPFREQPWRGVAATVQKAPGHWKLDAPDLNLGDAQVVWEAPQHGCIFSPELSALSPPPAWVEAEALLPDGRRVFAVTNLSNRIAR